MGALEFMAALELWSWRTTSELPGSKRRTPSCESARRAGRARRRSRRARGTQAAKLFDASVSRGALQAAGAEQGDASRREAPAGKAARSRGQALGPGGRPRRGRRAPTDRLLGLRGGPHLGRGDLRRGPSGLRGRDPPARELAPHGAPPLCLGMRGRCRGAERGDGPSLLRAGHPRPSPATWRSSSASPTTAWPSCSPTCAHVLGL
jgi:hypothetical protein